MFENAWSMNHLARFILRYNWVIFPVALAAAGIGFWQTQRLEYSESLTALVVRGDPRQADYDRMLRAFGDEELLAVAVDAEDVYRAAVLDAIDTLARRLEHVPEVRSVTGVTTVDRLDRGGPLGLPRRRRLYDPAAGDTGARRVRAYVRSHPLYRDRLVSRDERTALLLVRFRHAEDERVNRATQEIQRIVRESDRAGVRLSLAGMPLVRSELIRAARRDVNELQIVAMIVVVAILAATFRRVLPVVVGALVMWAGVRVSTGAIALLGIKMNNLLAMVPALVLIYGSSTSMHTLTRYLAQRRQGANRVNATARAFVYVGSSCFWSSATTAMGLLGLVLSRVPALRQVGAMSALGIGLTFAAAMGLVPAILTLGAGRRAPEPVRPEEPAAASPSPVTRFVARLVERRARWILLAAAALSAAGLYGITHLRVETNRLDYFRSTDPLRVAYDRVEEQFGGLTEIDVLVRGAAAKWLTPAAVVDLQRLEEALRAVPGIDGGLSLNGLLSHANQVDGGVFALPEDPVRLQAFLDYLTEGSGRALSQAFLSADRRTLRILLFTRRKGSTDLERLVRQVEETAAGQAPAGAATSVTGTAAVFAGMVRYVVNGQVVGVALVVAVLLVVMIGLTRGFWAGVIGLAPTVVPIVMLYGLMPLLGIPLNLFTSVVSGLAAGMAVDNAIHFLNTFRREYRRTGRYRESVFQTIHVVGRGLMVNCLLIAGGLGSFMAGRQLAVVQFGMLLALTMVNALVMGLLLLPALLIVFRPRVGGQ